MWTRRTPASGLPSAACTSNWANSSAPPSLREGGELLPLDSEIFLQLALTHQQLRQDKEADALFQHAIALNPESPLGYNLYGGFLFARERYDDAREYAERSLEDQPDNLDLLMRLGVCCFKTDDRHAAQAASSAC